MRKNKTNIFIPFFLAVLLAILPGCASIVSKSNYMISIHSNPNGANISVMNRKGIEVYRGLTPALINLKASAGFFTKEMYMVTYEMDGYDSRTVPIMFTVDGWYFGNLLFGGLIGMLIVDPATGAMWRLQTKFLNETLSQTKASIDAPALKVMNYNEIPETWKEHLVRMN